MKEPGPKGPFGLVIQIAQNTQIWRRTFCVQRDAVKVCDEALSELSKDDEMPYCNLYLC